MKNKLPLNELDLLLEEGKLDEEGDQSSWHRVVQHDRKELKSLKKKLTLAERLRVEAKKKP